MGREPTRSGRSLIVRRSRLRSLLIAMLALAFCVAAIWFAWQTGSWLERLFAVSMAIFLGLVAGVSTLIALDRTPVLEIDEEGLTDRGSPVRVGRVPWQSVRRVEAKSVGNRRYLVVQVYRPLRFLADLDAERRQAAEELIQRHGTPLVIPWEALDQSLDAVVEQAEALRQSAAR